jgi:tetratricopeptide (TPR) repeat protein
MSQEKMNSGITAFRNGNKKLALQIFSEIVKSEPRNEAAWLWLAAGVDNIEQKEFCFKKVLEINPHNENAQKALSQIKKPSVPSFDDLVNVSSGFSDLHPETVISDNKVKIQALKCPMCGASIGLNERECSYCGSTLIITSIEKTLSHKSDTQLLSTSADKWKSILRTDPDNPEANYALGLIYLNQKLRDAALQYLQKATLLMPDSAIVYYNLALTLFNDGNININSADYDNGIKAIDYATRLEPNFKEAKAFKHFFTARKIGDIDSSEAIKEYQKAIDICPDIAIFHHNQAFAYYNKKNYALAEKSYLKAIEIDPEFFIAYSNLCLLYYTTEKYKEGVRYGRRAIELLRLTTLDKYQADAYNNLSLCLWKTNQTKEAVEMVTKAIAINPQEPLYRNNLKTYKGVNVRVILIVLFVLFICFILFILWLKSIEREYSYFFTIGMTLVSQSLRNA